MYFSLSALFILSRACVAVSLFPTHQKPKKKKSVNLNFGHEHEKATFPLNRLQNGRRLIGSVFFCFYC